MPQQPTRRAVILTALSDEFNAVLAHLTDAAEEVHSSGTVYKRGRFTANSRTWDVAVALIGAGNSGASFECERAIERFDPHVALFVGVAGGLKKELRLGDVVVATRVYGYESGKADITFLARPDVGESSYRLVQRAQIEAASGAWVHRISSSPPRRVPKVIVKAYSCRRGSAQLNALAHIRVPA